MVALLLLAGCNKITADPTPPSPPVATRSAVPTGATPSYRYPEAERIVAIGDLHGDFAAARRVLRLAGAIDAQDRWRGGKLVVVQTGDQLDRGDGERAIVELLVRLHTEAWQAGGAVHALIGNHETMNVRGDFGYVTPGGYADFRTTPIPKSMRPEIKARIDRLPTAIRGRAAAFFPGGLYAKHLSKGQVAIQVGQTLFVHGGLNPEHVRYGIDRLNAETQAWMRGERVDPPAILRGSDAPTWTRLYSRSNVSSQACQRLSSTLRTLGAKRMVVGHTPQKSEITSACNGQVWRIDVGLAAFYGARTQVLEIRGDQIQRLGPVEDSVLRSGSPNAKTHRQRDPD